MSGHYSTLMRPTIETFLPDHDVYITDWHNARDIPLSKGRFNLDDYVDYLIDWFRQIGPDCHVIAVCQGAVPAFAALSLMEAEKCPRKPASMIMLGAPMDPRANHTEVTALAINKPLSWFENCMVTRVPPPYLGVMRKVYPGFLQLAAFVNMNLGDHMQKHVEMFDGYVSGNHQRADKTKAFYEEYRSVMDLSGEFYIQTIDVVFQRHLLPRGKLVSKGRPVDPAAIEKTALMSVEGANDDISAVGQTQAALSLACNLPDDMKFAHVAPGVGHYGIFSGSKWRSDIAPKIKKFIQAHD